MILMRKFKCVVIIVKIKNDLGFYNASTIQVCSLFGIEAEGSFFEWTYLKNQFFSLIWSGAFWCSGQINSPDPSGFSSRSFLVLNASHHTQ